MSRQLFIIIICGWQEILADGGKILADGGKYWRMAENTGGWQEILAEADSEKYSRIARNTCGHQKLHRTHLKRGIMIEDYLVEGWRRFVV
ncbi:hypothetical protein [Neobacillus vireti]|uniref:hypothetical protein n=1 Tax=Neobacillus vireti TaxID=220686 RepID=UPI0030006159